MATVLTDLVRDILVELHTRRSRTVLLALAIALSTGALVASLSISRMAALQIDTDLAATATRTIVVSEATSTQAQDTETFPDGAAETVSALPLVEAAGMRLDLTGATTVRVQSLDPVDGPEIEGLSVVGISSGYLAAAGWGAPTSAWTLDGAERVVMLGAAAADELDVPVSRDPTGHSIWINGYQYQVVGLLEAGSTASSVVAIPYHVVTATLGGDTGASMTVLTAPGGAGPVATAIRSAIRPDAPAQLTTSLVVDAADVRRGVSTQLDRLTAGIGWLLLALTMLLIANSMVVAVMARTPEIGLRRAMGASRRQIAALILGEGATAGLIGGASGAAVAATLVLLTAAINGWTARLDLPVLLLAPLLGLTVAGLASVYPAVRAAGIQPATAVRSD